MTPMPEPSGRYVKDTAGWNRVATTGEVLDACLHSAADGQVFAESIAPINSGEYKTRFSVTAAPDYSSFGPRMAAELSNDTPWAAAVEFGNDHVRGQYVFARTAAYLGGSP